MRGAIRSRLVFLIALLAAIFISVPGFSGEHPWDSDGKGNTSNSGGPSGENDDPSRGSTAIASSSAPLGSDSNTRLLSRSTTSLVFRISYYFAERMMFGQAESGTKARQAVRTAGR